MGKFLNCTPVLYWVTTNGLFWCMDVSAAVYTFGVKYTLTQSDHQWRTGCFFLLFSFSFSKIHDWSHAAGCQDKNSLTGRTMGELWPWGICGLSWGCKYHPRKSLFTLSRTIAAHSFCLEKRVGQWWVFSIFLLNALQSKLFRHVWPNLSICFATDIWKVQWEETQNTWSLLPLSDVVWFLVCLVS